MPGTGADGRLAGAGLALLIVLSACGTAPAPEPTESRRPEPAVTVASLTPVPVSEPTPQAPPAEATDAPRQAAATTSAEPVSADPNRLLQLSGKRVAALLGPASYVRRDGPAEIWQYRADHCVLDVFLYREGTGLSVAHVDLRKRHSATVPPRRCFADLLASRH